MDVQDVDRMSIDALKEEARGLREKWKYANELEQSRPRPRYTLVLCEIIARGVMYGIRTEGSCNEERFEKHARRCLEGRIAEAQGALQEGA
jgi:hypothetical protein